MLFNTRLDIFSYSLMLKFQPYVSEISGRGIYNCPSSTMVATRSTMASLRSFSG